MHHHNENEESRTTTHHGEGSVDSTDPSSPTIAASSSPAGGGTRMPLAPLLAHSLSSSSSAACSFLPRWAADHHPLGDYHYSNYYGEHFRHHGSVVEILDEVLAILDYQDEMEDVVVTVPPFSSSRRVEWGRGRGGSLQGGDEEKEGGLGGGGMKLGLPKQ